MIASNVFLFIPSGGEFILVILAVLLLFGADKIPEFAKLVGKGMKEFRKATEDIKREISVETKDIREEVKKGEQAIRQEINNIKNDVESATEDISSNPYSYENDLDFSNDIEEEMYPETETSTISQDDPTLDTSDTKAEKDLNKEATSPVKDEEKNT